MAYFPQIKHSTSIVRVDTFLEKELNQSANGANIRISSFSALVFNPPTKSRDGTRAVVTQAAPPTETVQQIETSFHIPPPALVCEAGGSFFFFCFSGYLLRRRLDRPTSI